MDFVFSGQSRTCCSSALFPVVAVSKRYCITARAPFWMGVWISCDWLTEPNRDVSIVRFRTNTCTPLIPCDSPWVWNDCIGYFCIKLLDCTCGGHTVSLRSWVSLTRNASPSGWWTAQRSQPRTITPSHAKPSTLSLITSLSVILCHVFTDIVFSNHPLISFNHYSFQHQ